MEAIRVIRNAHHILGLSTGVDLTEIKKRANHLLNLARIEETESYETDLPGASGLRTEQNIRKALEQLSTVKTRLIESFFWFETPSIQDHKSLKALSKGDFDLALQHWRGLSKDSPNWISKKNEALAYFVASYQTGKTEFFEKSLLLWREIGTSDQFWSFYREHYSITDDLGTDKSSFVELRAKLFEYLSWLALDLYRKNPNTNLVKIFFEQTGIVGLGIEEHILNPVVLKVKSLLDSINNSMTDAIRLRTSKVELETAINELSDYGVDDYSPIKALRETCAAKFRSLSISVNNNDADYALAKELLDAGAKLSNSDSYHLQVERDKVQINKNQEYSQFIANLTTKAEGLSAKGKWEVFKDAEATTPDSVKDEDAYLDLKRRLLIEYAAEEFSANRDAIGAKNEDKAASGMDAIHNELFGLIEIFALNKDKVQEMVNDLISRTRAISSPNQIEQVDRDLASVREITEQIKVDEASQVAFLIICQSAIWRETAPYIKRLRYSKYLITAGWITVYFYGLGVIFWIAAFCYRRKMF